MPAKLDLKSTLKQLYNPPSKQFTIVDVPSLNFLMIDGQGDPNTAQEYKDALETLYSVAYSAKFAIKKARGIDFTVMPLEGLWYSTNPDAFVLNRPEEWAWTMMIMQPDVVTAADIAEAIEAARKKKNLAALGKLRFATFHEGLSVQIVHIGPYKDEAPTLAKLHHEFIPAQGFEMAGKHHEIYLSDPSRTAPEKLKTVLRQPVGRKG